jgi:hypothetical protein
MPRTVLCFLTIISCTPEFKLVADECGVDEAQLFMWMKMVTDTA